MLAQYARTAVGCARSFGWRAAVSAPSLATKETLAPALAASHATFEFMRVHHGEAAREYMCIHFQEHACCFMHVVACRV